jgi:beta-1,4-mannosyltransferase
MHKASLICGIMQGKQSVTHLIGYGDAKTRLIPELEALERTGHLVFSKIAKPPAWMARIKVLKALHQAFVLFYMLFIGLASPDVILLQIPPAIPTMALCIAVAWCRRARLVFDWHNFAHTLMGYGQRKGTMVRIAEKYEKFLAPCAHGNLCVTRAMKRVLKTEYRNTQAHVFYDKPVPSIFKGRCSNNAALNVFKTLTSCIEDQMHPVADCGMACLQDCHARFSNQSGIDDSHPGVPSTRTRVLVSSTSWTPDEDFSILLDAMMQYDALAREDEGLPKILLIVTGKGPQKDYYIKKMKQLDLRRVAIRTAWLEPEDYPRLLGTADVGISLHASSSGVDLPMKVVDMLGSQLPVCALSYPCLAKEMVRHGKNGLLFTTSSGLTEQLVSLFEYGGEQLETMQKYIKDHPFGNWDTEWKAHARPILLP